MILLHTVIIIFCCQNSYFLFLLSFFFFHSAIPQSTTQKLANQNDIEDALPCESCIRVCLCLCGFDKKTALSDWLVDKYWLVDCVTNFEFRKQKMCNCWLRFCDDRMSLDRKVNVRWRTERANKLFFYSYSIFILSIFCSIEANLLCCQQQTQRARVFYLCSRLVFFPVDSKCLVK